MIPVDLESRKKFGDHDFDVGPGKYSKFWCDSWKHVIGPRHSDLEETVMQNKQHNQ